MRNSTAGTAVWLRDDVLECFPVGAVVCVPQQHLRDPSRRGKAVLFLSSSYVRRRSVVANGWRALTCADVAFLSAIFSIRCDDAAGIGVWLDLMKVQSVAAVIINCALLWKFRSQVCLCDLRIDARC